MVSKGQFVGLDWNRITRLHSQVMTGTQEPSPPQINIMLLLFHLEYYYYYYYYYYYCYCYLSDIVLT